MAWYDEIVGTTKGNVQGLVDALRNPVDTTKQFLKGGEKNRKIASALLQGNTAPLKQAFAEMTPQGMENAMMNVGMTYAPMGITAFHGSPFKFDKFDLSKAKQGTGVNLFGRGVYLTDNPDVAKKYAGESGYVYKVDLPDEKLQSMIPYMKKIQNQNEKVKELANRFSPELQKIMELHNLKNPNNQVTNINDLYTSDLFRAMGKLNKEAEPRLIKEGIPGVYHSNIGGNATNYVVYDPSILKILQTE